MRTIALDLETSDIDYAAALAEACAFLACPRPPATVARDLPVVCDRPITTADLLYPMPALDPRVRRRAAF